MHLLHAKMYIAMNEIVILPCQKIAEKVRDVENIT